MYKILNENYYIDMDKISDYVQLDDISGESQVHLVRYETTKLMLEVVFSESEDIDEQMGFRDTSTPMPFKLAFNSLLMKGIINKI